MNDVSGFAPPPAALKKITHRDLFLVFAKIGLLGFGGVTAWLRRVLVEEQGWLEDREFAELFGLASTLPGANTVAVSVMLGDRYQGPSGSVAAVTGLLAMPLLILAGIASLYGQFANLSDVKNAIAGAAAATAGLVIGNAFKMARNMKPDAIAYLIGAIVFICAGILQLPLLWTLLVVVPASILVLTIRKRVL
ncbi:chromate transporter [Methyloferula stellata]|uniref:chromate transporter n=1 Tax=Methyloferula stellata TaxID=876270 RepID=UPI00035C6E0A|nr:chromate transporter [Methyloferula stellata]